MNFIDAVKICFSKYVTFSGRAARPEYWWFQLFYLIVAVIASALDATTARDSGLSPFTSLATLAMLLPLLAVSVRRLHDTDRTGWWLLIGILPLIGEIVLLVFFCQRGTEGANRFGVAATPAITASAA